MEGWGSSVKQIGSQKFKSPEWAALTGRFHGSLGRESQEPRAESNPLTRSCQVGPAIFIRAASYDRIGSLLRNRRIADEGWERAS